MVNGDKNVNVPKGKATPRVERKEKKGGMKYSKSDRCSTKYYNGQTDIIICSGHIAPENLIVPLVGEVVSGEELGGATMHCSVSGITDHFAKV